MKHFFASRGIKVTAVLLTLVLALLVASLIWGGSGSVINDALSSLFAPANRLLTRGADGVKDIYAYIHEFDELKAENEQLKKQVAEMERDVRTARTAIEENERFRKLFNLMVEGQSYQIYAAEHLVSWGASSWSSTFTISGGTAAGILVGDSVITEEGFLVGQVIEVGASTAKVRTIIDIDFNVGALVEGSGVGVASGEFELMERGLLRLGFMTSGSNPPLNGDTVLTSGSGGVFPQGLVIGTVTAYKIDNAGMDWYGEVTPSADLSSLVEVFIAR